MTVPTGLLGLGMVGVGLFPLTHPGPHTVFALLAFYAGGLAIILSARNRRPRSAHCGRRSARSPS